MRAQARLLPDGRRLHLQDGPIDLVIRADGAPAAVRAAYAAATRRFETVLGELCAELTLLRAPARPEGSRADGSVARRMQEAVAPFADARFITPMAAVAGAVAEEVLAAMVATAPLGRAFVNNGGDIALHLSPDTSFRVGLVGRPDRPGLFGATVLREADGIAGIATSGWRGRSFSRGIADAVTVLATTAAQADAAATVIANAVDLPGHPAIVRVPARDLRCDSDLGAILVTREVGGLAPDEIARALADGRAAAERLIALGLVRAAALHLRGITKVAGSGAGPLSRVGEGRGEGPPSPRRQSHHRGAAAGARPGTALPSPGRPLPRALDLSLTGEATAGRAA